MDNPFFAVFSKGANNEIKNKDSNFVFFFGVSASGKSVILSSMLYYLSSQAGVLSPKIGVPNSREAQALLADFFENIITNKVIYPKKNPCFNLAFSKFYDNQYLFCVRNVVTYKQLINNINLYPGIPRYSNNESNMHNNNDISNNFIWDWKKYYQTYILT